MSFGAELKMYYWGKSGEKLISAQKKFQFMIAVGYFFLSVADGTITDPDPCRVKYLTAPQLCFQVIISSN